MKGCERRNSGSAGALGRLLKRDFLVGLKNDILCSERYGEALEVEGGTVISGSA